MLHKLRELAKEQGKSNRDYCDPNTSFFLRPQFSFTHLYVLEIKLSGFDLAATTEILPALE